MLTHRSDLTYRYRGDPVTLPSEKAVLNDRATKTKKSMCAAMSPKHVWVFKSGAKIFFASMQHSKDKTNYQGKRYDFIGFDELTHFTWEEYSYMFSRNRPSKRPKSTKKTICYIRATTNPGGVGHGWVKERFIDAAEPGQTIVEMVEVTMPDGTVRKIKRDRVFIQATIFDNQALLENDPGYLGSLALLPEKERDALLYGVWDVFEGQYFTEFRVRPDPVKCKEAGIMTNEFEMETFKDIKAYLRSVKISLGSARADIPDFNNFRKRNFGRFTLSKEGVPMDSLWLDLQDQFGKGFFPEEIVHPADQIQHIEGLYAAMEPDYANPYQGEMGQNVEACANEILDVLFSDAVRQTAKTFAGHP